MQPIKAMFGGKKLPVLTWLGGLNDTNTGNKVVAITAAVGDLLVVFASATGVGSITFTDDQGGTYTALTTALKTASNDLVGIWVRDQLCTVAGTHNVTGAMGVSSTGSAVDVAKLTNMTKAGVAAFRSNGTQTNQASGGTPAPVLNQAPLADSIILIATFIGANPATLTPRTGYTNVFAGKGWTVPSAFYHASYRIGGETATTLTFGSTYSGATWGSAAVEIIP